MDLIDRINDIANRIKNQKEHIQTEEATKNALIMPFISALGYDVFNPTEVIPEFTADVGTKKNEKVDYAISKDDHIIMLLECKWSGADLNKEHANQLFRYFSVTDSRFGILTNGVIYRFFSDLEKANKMDGRPFFEFNLLDFDDQAVEELKKFSKSAFDLDDILTTANSLKYSRAVIKVLENELQDPSDEFIRFFASKVYDGRLTQQVMDQFRDIVKSARRQFINNKINERLKSALNSDNEVSIPENEKVEDITESESNSNGVVTTEEELEGYMIVKAILRNAINVDRVAMRDTKSYCGILLDNNNRKPLCRLHFNTAQKYIGLIKNKKEERVPIESLNEIYGFSDQIVQAIAEYE